MKNKKKLCGYCQSTGCPMCQPDVFVKVELSELQDFNMTLLRLSQIVQTLRQEHGDDTLITCDAGANNVSFHLEKRKQ